MIAVLMLLGSRRSIAALLAAVWLSACDGHHPPGFDGGPTVDASTALGELSITSERSLLLAPQQLASFTVRWTNSSGMLVPMRDVNFALEGMPRDSSLLSLASHTNANGEASGTIIAGSLPATFRIRITAPDAVPAYIDVAVGAEGFGGLSIQLEEDLIRPSTRRLVLLHQGAELPCSDALTRTEADRIRTTEENLVADFTALPAGQLFTIVARAENDRGTVVSEGCIEEVRVRADRTLQETIVLVPRPLEVEGEYSTSMEFTADSSPEPLLASVADAVDMSISAIGGDAELMLDGLDTELRARHATELADMLMAERNELRSSLSTHLDGLGRTPSVAVHALIDDVAQRTSSIRINGTLAIARAAPTGSLASFTRGPIHVGPPAEPIVIDLTEHGVGARTSVSMSFHPSEDRLAIDELTLLVPLGHFAARIMDEKVRAQGGTSAVDLVQGESGCDQFALWLEGRPDITAECDAACVLSSCTHAIESVLSISRVAFGSLDDARIRILLSGDIQCRDSDGNLEVDALPQMSLSGSWSNPSGSSSAQVEVSFAGRREAL